ncbi:hypothetical protein FD755_011817 [Muntiacus reevesi]|uniref:Acyl-CoA-binding domain-containing protein 6 n=1 Tax=Muntiacus reevesi TaxID=9886 RepID=A0A5N3XVG1_MUNRE|nr:hypothetical protein FD755_011817 [Muntiacus reevesi]
MASSFLPSGATTGDSGGELSSGDDSGDVESLQSPEIEASRSLAELFEKAAAHLQGLVPVASREQLLYLYARYKQVKVGNCNTPKPSFFDFEGKQKWEAWKALGDSSPSQAMQEYIAVVKKLDPSWNPQDISNDMTAIKHHLYTDIYHEAGTFDSQLFSPHVFDCIINWSHYACSRLIHPTELPLFLISINGILTPSFLLHLSFGILL